MSDKEAFFIRACVPDIKQVEDLPDDYPPIWVRSMTVGQRAQVAKVATESDTDVVSMAAIQTSIILWCACKVDGERLFDAGARAKVDDFHAKVSDTIAQAALVVSGIDAETDDEPEGTPSDPGNATAAEESS